MGKDFSGLTATVHRLVRQGKYKISLHALKDHPERGITASDILECLKIGGIADEEPRRIGNEIRYEGDPRYRWFGEDQTSRVIRLILVIKANVIVVSAALATEGQVERYHKEDKES